MLRKNYATKREHKQVDNNDNSIPENNIDIYQLYSEHPSDHAIPAQVKDLHE